MIDEHTEFRWEIKKNKMFEFMNNCSWFFFPLTFHKKLSPSKNKRNREQIFQRTRRQTKLRIVLISYQTNSTVLWLYEKGKYIIWFPYTFISPPRKLFELTRCSTWKVVESGQFWNVQDTAGIIIGPFSSPKFDSVYYYLTFHWACKI